MRGSRGCHAASMLVPSLITLVVLALFVLAAIVIIRALRRNGGLGLAGLVRPDPVQHALVILHERLAKGEIEIDDSYARLSALKGHDPTPPR